MTMAQQKKNVKIKFLKSELSKELKFINNVFSSFSLPLQMKNEESTDFEMYNSHSLQNDEAELPVRAKGIEELEEKLQKIKSKHNFNLKNKLVKKSLTSKLNKKLKKKERLNKTRVKPTPNDMPLNEQIEKEIKPIVKPTKPIFNNEGKLVFSKFDFANVGNNRDKGPKTEKDPRKILENLKQQEEKFRELGDNDDGKVKELKEKLAWKTIFQKAEGVKVKDDPTLLKKSIKKMDQKKKHSKKQWDKRVTGVEQKKEERQKKRKENISKKKKEKKSKAVKQSVKRGRVVI